MQPHRNLSITWQPISLFLKNKPDEDNPRYEWYIESHRLLRVMESVRVAEGPDGVSRFYWELGRRIHHDKALRNFSPEDALSSAGLDASCAEGFNDEAFDATIRERMNRGLMLAGNDIGTPIIAFDTPQGEELGIFGPVITRVPSTEDSLKLWDNVISITSISGFWELKRTRTEKPDFGERP